MKLFQADIKICGTAYIVAESQERAQELLDQHFGPYKDYLHNIDGDFVVDTDFDFLVEQGEQATLSPAVTFYGLFDPDQPLTEITL